MSTLAVEKLEKKVRYKNVVVVPIGNEKFPNMVEIEKTTVKLKALKGKKFINPIKAQVAIEALAAENLINGGARKVKDELDSIGFLVEDTAW